MGDYEKMREKLTSLGLPPSSSSEYKPHPYHHHRNKRVESFLRWVSGRVSEDTVYSSGRGGGLAGQGPGISMNMQTEKGAAVASQQMKEKLLKLQTRLNTLSYQKSCLLSLSRELSYELKAKGSSLSRFGGGKAREAMVGLHDGSNAVDSALQDLVSTGRDLYDLFGSESSDTFLWQHGNGEYQAADAAYMKAVEAYIDIYFRSGVAYAVSQSSSYLGSGDDGGSVSGESVMKERHEEAVRELQRMGEMSRRNMMNHAMAQIALASVRSKAAAVRRGGGGGAESGQGRKGGEEMIKSLQKQRDSLQATLDSIVKEEIRQEIDQVAALNSIDVLNDNYDLKIHRQDYFTSKQDEIIRMLEEQQARHLLLGSCYMNEMDNMSNMNLLIDSLSSYTRKMLTALHHRMASYRLLEGSAVEEGRARREDPISGGHRNSGNAAAGKELEEDVFLLNLYTVLQSSSDSGKVRDVTWGELLRETKNYKTGCEAVLRQFSTMKSSVTECMQQLQRCRDQALVALHSGRAPQEEGVTCPKTITLPAKLVHPVIDEQLVCASSMKARLNEEFKGVLGEIQNYREMLSHEPRLQDERRIFVDFVLHPSSVLIKMQALRAREKSCRL